MLANYPDAELEKRVEDLKKMIKSWSINLDLWYDCDFRSWSEHFNDEPTEHPYILVLAHEGHFYDTYSSLHDKLSDLLKRTDFSFEHYDHTTICFYVDDKTLEEAYRDYYEWQWILELIKPDYDSLYEEIYERFQRKPDDLHRLGSRQFEQLLDAIFRNNGYRTELGSGQGDGGVDLRLYANDVVGEVVTLVQAKRYAKRPIRLEAVQALSAIVEDERANRGLFVTTSRFLPSTQKFAVRQNRKLALATSNEIQQWAGYASKRILRDKSSLISPTSVQMLLSEKNTNGLEGKIFVARTGYTISNNQFALV